MMKRDLDCINKRMIRRCRAMMKNAMERSKRCMREYRNGGNIEDYAYSRECRGYAMACKEIGEWLIENRTDENGDLDLSGLDFSGFEGNVRASGWKVRKSLDQRCNEVGGDLYQDNQKVEGSLHQGNQHAGWAERCAEGAVCQGPIQGERKMTPKEKGQFLLKYFKTEDGALELDRVDLSDFHGDVVLEGWKVGGDLFLDHQEVMGSLFQNNQKVRRNLFQDEQEAGGCIAQDMQEPNAQEAEGIPVGPDYEAEYERLQKELCEANGKIETLMWALGKAKEAGE